MQENCATIYSTLLGRYIHSLSEIERLLVQAGHQGMAALLNVHLMGLDEIRGLIEESHEADNPANTKECNHVVTDKTSG